MATAPTIEQQDDSIYVRTALESYLDSFGLPAGTEFADLPTSGQSLVLMSAQALKKASRA